MKGEELLQELEAIAGKFSIEVSYEKFDGAGGFCRVHDKKKIIINKSLSLEKKNEILLQEISKYELDSIYLKPELRKVFDDLA